MYRTEVDGDALWEKAQTMMGEKSETLVLDPIYRTYKSTFGN